MHDNGKENYFMFTSSCLNSAILAKYPSSTPQGESLKLIKRTNALLLHTHKKEKVYKWYFHVVVLQRTARVISKCKPQVQHAYLSDIGPIKFFIYCLKLSLSLLLWILKLPNNLTLHLRL